MSNDPRSKNTTISIVAVVATLSLLAFAMTDGLEDKLLLCAVIAMWSLLVTLVLWFVWIVKQGWNNHLQQQALSVRLILFGIIMTVLCVVQILAIMLNVLLTANIILFLNCLFPLFFAVYAFWGHYSEELVESPPILLTGLFAAPQQPDTSFGKYTVLRWWAYGICLSPLVFIPGVFIPGLRYWEITPGPFMEMLLIGLLIMICFIPVLGLAGLHLCTSYLPVRWVLVSNQQHKSSSPQQPRRNNTIAVKVECVAQKYYHDNVLRAFRGSIPLKLPAGSDRIYHITNPNSERIVLVSPTFWVEMTPNDPDSFIDAFTQALIQDPEDNILLSNHNSDEGSETAKNQP